MTIDTKEKRFEDIIEDSLLKNKYIKRNSNNFNKEVAIDIELIIQFLKISQYEIWGKLKKYTELIHSIKL